MKFLHRALLPVGILAAIFLWMLPVYIMGHPIDSPSIAHVYAFLESGVLPARVDGRLSIVLLSFVASFIERSDVLGWTLVAVIPMAVAVSVWWLCLRRLFDERIAWIGSLLFVLLPVYWVEAIDVNMYMFTFLFLFLSAYSYLTLVPKNRYGGIVLAGAFVGAAAASKNVFFLFLPWILFYALWKGRTQWQARLKEVLLFLVAASFIYSAPVLLYPSNPSLSFSERIVEAIPGGGELSPLEFYPDKYTFEFEKEWYDKTILEKSQYDQVRLRHRLLSLGVSEYNVFDAAVSGSWLLFHAGVLPLFFQETTGGIFLWFFIPPGFFVLYRQKREIFWWCLGLMISLQLLIRFGLHFQRVHLMNDAWILVGAAALGVSAVIDACARQSKVVSKHVILILFILGISLQLLQVNRVHLAKRYSQSRMLVQLEASRIASLLPHDSVIAVPAYNTIGSLSDRESILFAESTVKRILDRREASDAFGHYGVTHVLGYSNEVSERLREQVSQEVTEISPKSITSSPPAFLRYLLHLIR